MSTTLLFQWWSRIFDFSNVQKNIYSLLVMSEQLTWTSGLLRNNCSGSDKFRAFLLFHVPAIFYPEYEVIESTKNVFFLCETDLFNEQIYWSGNFVHVFNWLLNFACNKLFEKIELWVSQKFCKDTYFDNEFYRFLERFVQNLFYQRCRAWFLQQFS